MTKAEVVQEIAQRVNVEKNDVLAIVECFMEAVKGSLANGENVYLRGFGTFLVKERAEKKCRDITRGIEVMVPAHREPKFKPAREFKEMVK